MSSFLWPPCLQVSLTYCLTCVIVFRTHALTYMASTILIDYEPLMFPCVQNDMCKHMFVRVDRFFIWVPIQKTTQGRPNECQILYLGITIKLIDRSQRD